VKKLNAKLRRIWKESNGYEPDADRLIREIDQKIANIRQSIEDGFAAELDYFNQRLIELPPDRQRLLVSPISITEPLQIVPRLTRRYLAELDNTIACGIKKDKNALFGVLWT